MGKRIKHVEPLIPTSFTIYRAACYVIWANRSQCNMLMWPAHMIGSNLQHRCIIWQPVQVRFGIKAFVSWLEGRTGNPSTLSSLVYFKM